MFVCSCGSAENPAPCADAHVKSRSASPARCDTVCCWRAVGATLVCGFGRRSGAAAALRRRPRAASARATLTPLGRRPGAARRARRIGM